MGKTVSDNLHPTMAQALKPFLMFLNTGNDGNEVSNDDDIESD